jgi:hypothetical protein
MQPEEQQRETEAAAEPEREEERGPEPGTPPIDEDVAGSVNAAVPDNEE